MNQNMNIKIHPFKDQNYNILVECLLQCKFTLKTFLISVHLNLSKGHYSGTQLFSHEQCRKHELNFTELLMQYLDAFSHIFFRRILYNTPLSAILDNYSRC